MFFRSAKETQKDLLEPLLVNEEENEPVMYTDFPPEITQHIGEYLIKENVWVSKVENRSKTDLEKDLISEEKRLDEDTTSIKLTDSLRVKKLSDNKKHKDILHTTLEREQEKEEYNIMAKLLNNPKNVDIVIPLFNEKHDTFKYSRAGGKLVCAPIGKGFDYIAKPNEGDHGSSQAYHRLTDAIVICCPAVVACCPIATVLSISGLFCDGVRYAQRNYQERQVNKAYNDLFLQETQAGPERQRMD